MRLYFFVFYVYFAVISSVAEKYVRKLFTSGTGWLIPVIVIAAFFATLSYLCYYKAIARIGATKAMVLNITYVAWALVFTVVIQLVRSQPIELNAATILCALVVLVCGIFAAADFRELFARKKA